MTALGVPALVYLGLWQLERREEKAALLARLEAQAERTRGAPVRDLRGVGIWPRTLSGARAVVRCAWQRGQVVQVSAGQSRTGESGYSYVLSCSTTGRRDELGGWLAVNMGWSQRPDLKPRPLPGDYEGVLITREPGCDYWPYTLVLDRAVAPLAPSAVPAAADVPNNHLSYAVQWFGFALTLAVVYALYVRRWRRERQGPPVLS